jgi:hypothetical protein
MRDRLPAGFGPVLARSLAVLPRERGVVVLWTSAYFLIGNAGFIIRTPRHTLDPRVLAGEFVFWLAWLAWISTDTVRPGHGWFAERWRFVRTDRLTRVWSGVALHGGCYTVFCDADGRRLKVFQDDLRRSSEIWQLVADGVAISVANGLHGDDRLSALLVGVPVRTDLKPPLFARLTFALRRRRAAGRGRSSSLGAD